MAANYTLLENASFVQTGASYLNTENSPLDTFTINASGNGAFTATVIVEQSSDNVTFSTVKSWSIASSVYFSDVFTINVPVGYFVRARVSSISGLNAKVSVLFSASISSSTSLLNSIQLSSGTKAPAGVGNGVIFGEDGLPIKINMEQSINSVGILRVRGAGAQTIEGQGNVNGIMKVFAKAPFFRVRLTMLRKDVSPCSQIKAMVAATNKKDNDTIANAYYPNGDVNNNVLTSTSKDVGWSNVTFGTDTTFDGFLYGGTGQPSGYDPNGTYHSCPDIVQSDWIQVRSSSPDNALLIRLRATGFQDSTAVTNNASGSYSVGLPGDASDLAQVPAAVPTGSGQFPYILVEFDHGVPVRNFLLCGDSITESYRWNSAAIDAVSTSDTPCYSINMGASSHRWDEFTAISLQLLKKNKNITDIVIPTFSPNDASLVLNTSFTVYGIDVQKAKILELIDLCNQAGIQVWLWTCYFGYKNPGNVNNDFRTVDISIWARAICAQGKAKLVDVQSGWVESQHLAGDAVHPKDPQGISYMQSVFETALRANGLGA